ncbi:MAG: SDR family NAD(P)-dependent oxidoreductase, partial [Vicinamibacteria bacterium]
MHRMDFHGQTALVTGGARGLGRAIARALGRRGCRVILLDVLEEAVEETASALRAEGLSATPVACDLRSLDAATKAVDEIQAMTGGVDILVNNAGGGGTGPFVPLGRESIERTVA